LPVLLAVLAALSFSSCFVLPEEERVLGPPVMKPPEVEYSTVAAERKDIARQVYLYGHLVPVVDKELFFRYQGGRLTNIYVELGQQVKAGQLLAELDLGNLFNQLEQRQISLEKAKIRYDMSSAFNANKFDLRLAELDIRLAELQLQDIQARIGDARLISPIDGTIVNIDGEEGSFVSAFQPVIRVVNPDDLILECEPGKDSDQFYTGMLVEVIIKGETVLGDIIRSPRDSFLSDDPFSQAEELDTILIEVRDIPDTASMSDIGRVILTLDESENAIVLPKNLIHRYAGRTYVNVLEQGLKQEKYVEIGIETSNEVEILRGLDEGDLVIRD
jgi:RND family efflux transporter MFP subunit